MRNPTTWIVVSVLALATALRLYGIDWGLPQVYEEAYPLKKSWDMWGWADGQSFTLDPKFFNYPTLYMYVQLLGQAALYGLLTLGGKVSSLVDFQLLYTLDPTPFYLMGRGLTTAFALGTVAFTFAIGRRVAGTAAGSIAALLVAVNGFHIAKSQAIEVDVPLTFFVLVTGWFALQIPDAPRLRNYLLAGLFAGLATSTKYSGGLLPLMIFLAHVVALHRAAPQPEETTPSAKAPARPTSRRAKQKARGKGAATATAVAPATAGGSPFAFLFGEHSGLLWRNLLLAALVCVAALVATSPYIVLDWDAFETGFRYERTHMKTGHFGLDSTPAILYYARVLSDQILGWPLLVLSVLGFFWVLVAQRRAWAVILASFPVVYVLILSSWSMKADRYILPVLPIACLMASVLLIELLGRWRQNNAVRGGVAAVVLIAMTVPAVAEYRSVLMRARGDTRTVARQWILENIPAGAYLVTEAYGPEPFNAIVLTDMNQELRQAMTQRHSETPVYGLLQIPMLQVKSEFVAPFYVLEQYISCDYLMTTSSVRQRYVREPHRYPAMMAFYEELDRDWELVKVFDNTSMIGPVIHLYKNPHQEIILGNRGEVRAPSSLPRFENLGSGLVGSHMQRIGANLEVFGYVQAAAEAFELALTYPPLAEDVERSVVLRAMQARLRLGDRQRALQLLDAAQANAKTPQKKAMWQALRQRHFANEASP